MIAREQVVQIVKQCLEEGRTVEIDGLGLFRPGSGGKVAFVAGPQPRVFLAYACEDGSSAERLFDQLQRCGFDPWLDRRKLLPGQNWPRAIEQAIGTSDFFVACFSKRSTARRSNFHSELRYALDCARRLPLDGIYFIPVRLDNCMVPGQIANQIQYVDLFPDWNKGFRRIVAAMRKEWRSRAPEK